MSSYKNHWSSTSENNNQIYKLSEDSSYQIKDVERLQTSFGKKYVLIDEDDNKYWTNNQIDEFIKEHKEVKKFELITSEYKTFINKKGDEIRYLAVDINY